MVFAFGTTIITNIIFLESFFFSTLLRDHFRPVLLFLLLLFFLLSEIAIKHIFKDDSAVVLYMVTHCFWRMIA